MVCALGLAGCLAPAFSRLAQTCLPKEASVTYAAPLLFPDRARGLVTTQASSVLVKVIVGADGTLEDASIYRSSGNMDLDREALRSAKSSKYAAAQRDCSPVKSVSLVRSIFYPPKTNVPGGAESPQPPIARPTTPAATPSAGRCADFLTALKALRAPTFITPAGYEASPSNGKTIGAPLQWSSPDGGVLAISWVPNCQAVSASDWTNGRLESIKRVRMPIHIVEAGEVRVCNQTESAYRIQYTAVLHNGHVVYSEDNWIVTPLAAYAFHYSSPTAEAPSPQVQAALDGFCVPH